MEGGGHVADSVELTECWKTTWKKPYIMRLALTAGIGGLLFGYDTGVISGALLYIKEDFAIVDKKTWLQETIVSMAVAGAIIGAAVGGWMNDTIGRRISILCADFLFFVGAIIMAVAPAPWLIIVGRIFVGLGVGMASMTAPLYISESSPARIRGALVSLNGLLITGGQFVAYLINLAFTKAPGTWRWMLGVAAVPALVQFILMLSLPESPRYLFRKDKKEQAEEILRKIYPANEVPHELEALRLSVEAEISQEGAVGQGSIFTKVGKAWSEKVVRRGLYAGITVQMAQQFCGINTVMYYSPMIVQFAGFASNKTAMALSLITSGLNAIGSLVSMTFVDRVGRRRMMLISMMGIIVCLVILSGVFVVASHNSPAISKEGSLHFGKNSTCSKYTAAPDTSSWSCMTCTAYTECAFCSDGSNNYHPGACLARDPSIRSMCRGEHHRTWYTEGCPSKIGFLAVILLGAYIISYSPGMGTAPWIVNSEIYPLRFRGIGGGMAATANWISNLIVSQSFLSIKQALGAAATFLLFALFSFIGLVGIYILVPETKGLPIEEVETMLERGFEPKSLKFVKKKLGCYKEGDGSDDIQGKH